MTTHLSAYVDAICDGATEPVSDQQRSATLASFSVAFPHLSALLAAAQAA